MLYYIVVPLHVLVSVVLILVVLLQTGKRADLAGAFGGGGSQTAFGPRGASNFFSKLTTISAVLFMLTSLGLAILSTQATGRSRSVLDELDSAATAPAPIEQPAPAETAPPPVPEVDPDDPLAVPPDPGATEQDAGDGSGGL